MTDPLPPAVSAPPGGRRDRDAHARRAVLFGIGCFFALQAALVVRLDCGDPLLRDPEFGVRLARLRTAAEANGPAPAPTRRPLVVVIGGSRAVAAVQPETLEPPADAADPAARSAPLLVNLAHIGSGPVLNRMELRRVLDSGAAPDLILIEAVWPFLHRDVYLDDPSWEPLPIGCVDLAAAAGSLDAAFLAMRWLPTRVFASDAHRMSLMTRLLPKWLPEASRRNVFDGLDPLGGYRGLLGPFEERVVRQATDNQIARYRALTDGFAVSPGPAAAMRGMLEDCRSRGRRAVVFLPSEAPRFRRDAYPPGARETAVAFLAEACRDSGFLLIDLDDGSHPDADFVDGLHLGYAPAARFSRTLTARAVTPFLPVRGP